MSGNSFIPQFTLDNIVSFKAGGQDITILCMGLHSVKLFEGKVSAKHETADGLSAIAKMVAQKGAKEEPSLDSLEIVLIKFSMCDPVGNILFDGSNDDVFDEWIKKLPYKAGLTIIKEIMDLNELHATPDTLADAFAELSEDEQNEFKDWYLEKKAKDAKAKTKKK